MKNTLAENMLRFGTKNLSESFKQRLTEAVVDLMKDPAAPGTLKALQSQYAKGNMAPAAVMGAYYLIARKDLSNATILRGKVGGLNGKGIGGVGTIPVPASTLNGEGGEFELGPTQGGLWTKLTYDNAQLSMPADAKGIANELNKVCNEYPIAVLQSMLNAHPKKVAYQQAIAAFKASASAIKPLLTGNAKAFYGV